MYHKLVYICNITKKIIKYDNLYHKPKKANNHNVTLACISKTPKSNVILTSSIYFMLTKRGIS